jgi:hypothetical protein
MIERFAVLLVFIASVSAQNTTLGTKEDDYGKYHRCYENCYDDGGFWLLISLLIFLLVIMTLFGVGMKLKRD